MNGRYLMVQAIALGSILGLSWVLTGPGGTISGSAAAPDKVNLAVGYQVDPEWPRKPAGLEWGQMPGLAVDAQDQVWIFHRGKTPVQVFGRDGVLVRSWDNATFKSGHHMKIGPEGNVWLTDSGAHTVYKYSPEGERLMTLGTPGEPGEDDRHFNRPTDMAITPAGDIFVTDGYGNSRVVHFDAEGRFVKTWGKLGTAPGEFDTPHGIVVDSKGRLYVADRSNARVQIFDQSGRFLAEWRNLMVPWGIWVTETDDIYVCGSSPMRWGSGGRLGAPPKDQLLMKLNTEGRVLEHWTFPLGTIGESDPEPGSLNWVHAVAVDSRGDVYLCDIQGQRVQRMVRLN